MRHIDCRAAEPARKLTMQLWELYQTGWTRFAMRLERWWTSSKTRITDLAGSIAFPPNSLLLV